MLKALTAAALLCLSPSLAFENDTEVLASSHVLLQTFDWKSLSSRGSHFAAVNSRVGAIKSAGFTGAWLPPISQSVDKEGYLPQEWYRIEGEANLRALVGSLKSSGIMAIADIVVNHRTAPQKSSCTNDYTEFKNPDMGSWAVVRNDNKCEGGVFCPSNCQCGAADTGENICYAPDLDHTNSGVQSATKAFVTWLRTNVGFTGSRWDVAKGFSAKYFGDYIAAGGFSFSVGEYWDGDAQKVVNWIDGTGGRSSAFDFPARYTLQSAIRSNNFGALGQLPGVLRFWPDKSVTFVDNHDTTNHGDVFGDASQIVMAYAFFLTHPGVPCVYWGDWNAHASAINTMISLRKEKGINSNSKVSVAAAQSGLYAAYIDGKMALKLGTSNWNPSSGYKLRFSGNKWSIWTT